MIGSESVKKRFQDLPTSMLKNAFPGLKFE